MQTALRTLGNDGFQFLRPSYAPLLQQSAAFDSGAKDHLVLRIETFTLLTSVRVHCPRNLHMRDEPFGIRERVLDGFAFAWGKREHRDGSVDLWAELARRATIRLPRRSAG